MVTQTSDVERVLITLTTDGAIRGAQQERLLTIRDGDVIMHRSYLPAEPLDAKALASVLPDSAALLTQVAALQGALTVAEQEIDRLREQLRAALGTPTFLAGTLLQQLTVDDNHAIAQAIVNSPDLLSLYSQLQQRGSVPIPIDSETFRLGLAGLKSVLGDDRVRSVFAALNIDIDRGCYIIK